MGGHLSCGTQRLLRRGQDLHLLMAGLTGAGKTTFLHEMRLGGVLDTELAPGLVVQKMTHRGFKTAISFTVMDVEGDMVVDPDFFGHFTELPNSLVFVIDSSDIARLEEAKAVFNRMLAFDALGEAPLLVLVSKMDTPQSMSLSQIAAELGLHSIVGRRWRIQPCSVTDKGIDQSIFKGLDWLAKVLRSQAQNSAISSPPLASQCRPRACTDASSPSSTGSTMEPEISEESGSEVEYRQD
mmetsp:Transcript_40728/g.103566  ORF Transcript_40728/g.103566 Transcript_40728/m.103566 type:complete len:240 (-) Transcript_40728:285-1004(-)